MLSRACLFAGLVLILGLVVPGGLTAQEIPLEHCDALPIIKVEVDGKAVHFLVDTAATSLLNLKSFAEGRARDVRVTSWMGTVGTNAREVTISELVVGRTKLILLKFPAIDLSGIGNACGRKIDGVFGVDLLAKIGATIDLKRQTMHVPTAEDERGIQLAKESREEMLRCVTAFNDSDERSFADCLDPQITLLTREAALRGREPVLGYFRQHYFQQKPGAKLEMHESAFHPSGDTIWYEYEFTGEFGGGSLTGRWTMLCHKSDGRWRMVSMQDTTEQLEPALVCEACARSR